MSSKISSIANRATLENRKLNLKDVNAIAKEVLDGPGKSSTVTAAEKRELYSVYDNNTFTPKASEAMENLVDYAADEQGVKHPKFDRQSLMDLLMTGERPVEDTPTRPTPSRTSHSVSGSESSSSSSSSYTPPRRSVSGHE